MKTNNKITYKNRRRIILIFSFIAAAFIGLVLRLGWHQIIRGDEYKLKAIKQQTADNIITAVRGSILDANGNELAASVTKNTIRVRTQKVRENGKNDEEIEVNARAEAVSLAAFLNLNEEDVYNNITGQKNLVRIAKYVDNETADLIRAEKMAGVEITEDHQRYYPMNTFASHVIGITNDDNVGIAGLEYYYNDYLSGINGRWITSKDVNKNSLIYGTDKYYNAQDGYNILTTIDDNIQFIIESELDEYKEITGASRVMAIAMNPKDGSILGMAQTNDFNPNDPRTPIEEDDKKEFAKMTDEEKVAYWNKLWRCFCISDTYEPGSTFKLMTTSIALDTGAAKLSDTFTCNGTITVADRTLKCWYYPRKHGVETLTQAVGNSCNPVMVQLIQKIGLKAYYEGLDSFGLTEKTGVDYPGEGNNIIYATEKVGPVELATMAYGQGISVTPISLVTAVSSLANGGYVMQPHFMKEILDSEGNVVESFVPTVKGVSVSSQTAKDMLSIMEYVVAEGGGGNAKIPGYRIGGKTGTASKPTNGGYSDSDYCSSFIGVAPVDDPQFVLLVIVDSPKGKIYGSQTAAPCAKGIMQEMLNYLNIEPQYTEKELKSLSSKKTAVPDVREQGFEDAVGMLAGCELNYQLTPAIEETNSQIIIIDQYPKPGEEVLKQSKVTLYYELVENEEEIIETN